MVQIQKLSYQNLEDVVDAVIGFVNSLKSVELTPENIDNIYDPIIRDSYVVTQAAIKKYGVDPKDSCELTEEGKKRHRKRMLKRHGKILESLCGKFELYHDNLPSLSLPEYAINELKKMIDYYNELKEDAELIL